jgi:hypothetical protein
MSLWWRPGVGWTARGGGGGAAAAPYGALAPGVSRVGFITDSLEEVGREGTSGVSTVRQRWCRLGRRRCWRGDAVSLIRGSREEGFREVALALFTVVSWSRSSYFSRSLYIVGQVAMSSLHRYQVRVLTPMLINLLASTQLAKNFISFLHGWTHGSVHTIRSRETQPRQGITHSPCSCCLDGNRAIFSLYRPAIV